MTTHETKNRTSLYEKENEHNIFCGSFILDAAEMLPDWPMAPKRGLMPF
jgi:hypothetical protein